MLNGKELSQLTWPLVGMPRKRDFAFCVDLFVQVEAQGIASHRVFSISPAGWGCPVTR